jgi:hypothetical protein
MRNWDYALCCSQYGILDMSPMTRFCSDWFSLRTRSCLIIIHFCIYNQSVIVPEWFFTVGPGQLPVPITNYWYWLIFLHGSTCWLGDSVVPNIQLEKLSGRDAATWLRREAIGGYISDVFLLLVIATSQDGYERRDFNSWEFSCIQTG